MTDHIAECPLRAFNGTHSDAAKRLSDQWSLHRIAAPFDSLRRWFAIRLDDGSSDGVLYDTKQDAIRHQKSFDYHYAFICIGLGQMNLCDAEIYLSVNRRFADKGLRMTDPDVRNGGPDHIIRSTREDQYALAFGRVQNLLLPGRDF